MTQQEFSDRFISEQPMYQAWGNIVTRSVIERLPAHIDPKVFFKVEPEPRVKTLKSLVEKAFYRIGKNYANPYDEITDKVGTRFVVLLEREIEIIKGIIVNNADWDISVDKDYEEQQEKFPLIFDYQSVHIVVRNKYEVPYENAIIKPWTPCEVQIRTILQHAYSELTHDTIYKPSFSVPNCVHRLVARSMALIETTSNLFSEVEREIDMKYSKDYEFLNKLEMLYSEIKNPDVSDRMNFFIYETIRCINEKLSIEELRRYIDEHPDIVQAIEKGYDNWLLYRQPVVLLLSYLVKEHRSKLKRVWPYTEDELVPLFIDLGVNPYSYKN